MTMTEVPVRWVEADNLVPGDVFIAYGIRWTVTEKRGPQGKERTEDAAGRPLVYVAFCSDQAPADARPEVSDFLTTSRFGVVCDPLFADATARQEH